MMDRTIGKQAMLQNDVCNYANFFSACETVIKRVKMLTRSCNPAFWQSTELQWVGGGGSIATESHPLSSYPGPLSSKEHGHFKGK